MYYLNLEQTTFRNDQIHEIVVNDIFVQSYKQKFAKIQIKIEAFRG